MNDDPLTARDIAYVVLFLIMLALAGGTDIGGIQP